MIRNKYHLSCPACVADAITDYRNSCNWLQDFLDESCDVSPKLSQPSGVLYTEYLAYCTRTNERFFHSRWFSILTEADGEYILRRLEQEAASVVRGKYVRKNPANLDEISEDEA